MEDLWPSGAALRGEASNHLKRLQLNAVVVSVEEKAAQESSDRDLVNTNAETETRNDGGLVDCGAA